MICKFWLVVCASILPLPAGATNCNSFDNLAGMACVDIPGIYACTNVCDIIPGIFNFLCTCVAASVDGDPHLKLPEGGVADLRGEDGVFYNLLSAPAISFSMMTTMTKFLLPKPLLVEGSFFTKASCIVRGLSGQTYAILGDANDVGFHVLDPRDGTLLARRHGVWQEWSKDGVVARVKQSTSYIRANGWEVNVTRRPIYNKVSGPSSWRYDMQLRKLDGTAFEAEFGRASPSCLPHGIIGQAFDGDGIGISGKLDDYDAATHASLAVLTTTAQAEGAIEGNATEYKIAGPLSASFKYSRFDKCKDDVCAPRDVAKLSGAKVSNAVRKSEVASTTEKVDEALAAAPL